MKARKYLIGIDEVGRGPLAGPVAVGAFVFLNEKSVSLFKGVKESKQLSEEEREEWFLKIVQAKKFGHIDYSVCFQSSKVIDSRGISHAIKRALKISLSNLNLPCEKCRVLLDGGLKAPANYPDQKTIIKGDEKMKVIALASICAKVLRDRRMRKYAKNYPEYFFEENKGYGTRKHMSAIRINGLSDIHRKSFCGRAVQKLDNGSYKWYH